MIWDNTDRSRLFVVDADQTNYAQLMIASANRKTEVVFFASGKEALRATPTDGPVLWIVNLELPDMTGVDFKTLLRDRGNRSPMALVGNEYSVADEIRARTAGVEMYFAKSMVHEAVMATA